MKTFRQLSIGDTIFQLCESYDLGNPEKEQITQVVINNLAVDETSGNLLINKITTYSRDTYWSLIITKDKLDKDYYRFDPEKNTHRKGFFFINKEHANYIVKRAVMGKINKIEKDIPKYVSMKKAEICSLRKTFHELLNPSYYPEFKIIT